MTVTINGTTGITSPEVVLDNAAADGGQVVLKSSGYSDWNWDNYSGRLRAYYNATEYFTITNSGNVGVGVTPSAWALSGAQAVQIKNASITGYLNNAYLSANVYFDNAGASRYIASAAATQYAQNSGAHYWYVGASGTAGNAISFTQAMTLDASGNLLVGTTSGAGKFSVQGNGASNYAAEITNTVTNNNVLLIAGTSGSNSQNKIVFANGGSVCGTVSSTATTVAYNTSSDYRLKENIQPMQNALVVVAQLKPVTYTWKADGSAGQGFIAHELQEVVPDCVTGEKDAVETYIDEEGNEQTRPVYQGIDTSFLVATLTAAIQEQQTIITTLTARIEALEAKNA